MTTHCPANTLIAHHSLTNYSSPLKQPPHLQKIQLIKSSSPWSLTSLNPSMAQTTSITILSLLFILLETLMFMSTVSGSSIHDLLKSEGLPGGLFPRNIRSYTLHEDGLLEVYMGEPCLAVFESPVKFDTVVRANLSYGGLIGVQGLTQEELFLWLPVKDIIVKDPSSGLILFNIGVAQKQLAFSIFEDPPVCNPQRSYMQVVGRKEMSGHHQVQVQR